MFVVSPKEFFFYLFVLSVLFKSINKSKLKGFGALRVTRSRALWERYDCKIVSEMRNKA